MKKTLPIAIIAISLLGLGSLTSCHDEDFDVSTTVLQERAFEQNFIKEFGKPSANQSWDFYSLKMEAIRNGAGVTRAGEGPITVTVDTTLSQPTSESFSDLVNTWAYALEENHDNSDAGQNHYTLTSTGDFKIYAVRYAGGIEVQDQWKLNFGIMYYDPSDSEDPWKKVQIFGPGYRNIEYKNKTDRLGFGNPGKAAEVQIPKGVTFYFYLQYTYHFDDWTTGTWPFQTTHDGFDQDEIFYSNESPTFIQRNGEPQIYTEYDGASTLLYSTEYINEETNTDEQVMMIGFEDAWGHTGQNGTNRLWALDRDFNDVVVVIEGQLPLPTAKRFFCEDKESCDWDYNDVVFDVTNTGIVLRAVGGTLPVFLRVQNRLQNSAQVVSLQGEPGKDNKTYCELHELMRSQQFQTDVPNKPNPHKNAQLTYEVDGKTYYRPIDVGIDPQGLWLDPVKIVTWTSLGTSANNTRLEEGEVERFANPFVDDPVGDIELVVLPQSQYSSTGYDVSTIAGLSEFDIVGDDSKDSRPRIIKLSKGIPAVWSGPVSIQWMKELQKITLGYPDFYGNGTPSEFDGQPQWWESVADDAPLYNFRGDGGDTY